MPSDKGVIGTKMVRYIDSNTLQLFTNRKDQFIDFVEDRSNFDTVVLSGGEEYVCCLEFAEKKTQLKTKEVCNFR